MSTEWILAAAPLIGLCADVIAQALAARVIAIAYSIILGGVIGLVVTSAISLFAVGFVASSLDCFAGLLATVITFLALAFNYWMFLNLNITSLRIRVLRELLQEGGSLTIKDLKVRYPADEFLGRRLQRLERARQIRRAADGKWRLESPTLLVLIGILRFLRAFAIPAKAVSEAAEPTGMA